MRIILCISDINGKCAIPTLRNGILVSLHTEFFLLPHSSSHIRGEGGRARTEVEGGTGRGIVNNVCVCKRERI